MAITQVGIASTHENGTGSTSLECNQNFTASGGDEIVLIVAGNQIASIVQIITSVTSPANCGEFTKPLSQNSPAVGLNVWRARATGNVNLLTDGPILNINGSLKIAAIMLILRGTDAGAWPAPVSAVGDSNAPASGSLSSIASDSWLVGCAAVENIVTVSTEDPDFSQAATVVSSSGGGGGATKITAIAEVDETPGSSESWDITISASQPWGAGLIEVKAVAVAAQVPYRSPYPPLLAQ